MRRLLLTVSATALLASAVLVAQGQNWPHWRGPTSDGVAAGTNLPVKWGATCVSVTDATSPAAGARDAALEMPDGAQRGGREGRPLQPLACSRIDTQNVAWKLPLPAYSGSTPIIWGDVIFLNVATAANTGELELWAIDRNTQAVLWKRPIAGGNNMQRKQNMSSPSPVTDGRHVWVLTGVGALKAFDFKGAELWSRSLQDDYGRFGLNWGYASSPLLKDNALYVQVLHGMKTDDPSYLLKIDATTGKTLWKVERPTIARNESPDSYTTPLWVPVGTGAELVITGGDAVTGHDPSTGKELWRADVLNPTNNGAYRIVASATLVDGLIIAPSRVNPLVAIRPGGRGDVAATHIAWQFAQGPDVPSPVSDGKLLYVVRDTGVVFALDVKTGATVYGPERLPTGIGDYSASPVLADGKIYVTTEGDGVTTVFRAGPKFEILASNSLAGDCSPYCLSTVAISDGQLFIRTSSYLWAVGERRRR
jgi:outer membrane protein assembly factor BamB